MPKVIVRTAGWLVEFGPDFEVPKEVTDLVASGALQDYSWGNDACPSFGKEVAPDTFVRLFVEDPDPNDREIGGARFSVQLDKPDGSTEFLLETDDLGAALRTLMGKAKAPAPREKALERMYDLFHKTRSQEEQGELEGLVKEHGRPKFMSRNKTIKTQQVNEWISTNCKFAMTKVSMTEECRGVIRTAAVRAGISGLTEGQVDFLFVRAAVRAVLAQADLASMTQQWGLDLDAIVAEAVQKHKKNIAAATQEVFAILERQVEGLRRTRPEMGVPSFGVRPGSQNWNAIKTMVVQYANEHPEAIFEGSPKGFLPPQPERARGNMPMRTDSPPLTIGM